MLWVTSSVPLLNCWNLSFSFNTTRDVAYMEHVHFNFMKYIFCRGFLNSVSVKVLTILLTDFCRMIQQRYSVLKLYEDIYLLSSVSLFWITRMFSGCCLLPSFLPFYIIVTNTLTFIATNRISILATLLCVKTNVNNLLHLPYIRILLFSLRLKCCC